MQQLTYVSGSKLEWHDVPAPKPQSDQDAIVRPVAVTRCDLDLLIASGAAGWSGPFALGHEAAGIVVETGDAVIGFAPGDRVIVPFQISCGYCEQCRKGQTGNCHSVPFRSSYGMAPLSGTEFGGALSDLMRVPFADHMLVLCPDEVELSTAAGLADNVSDGFRLVAGHIARNPEARILVLGGTGQGLGLLAAQAAQSLGAKEVVYQDDNSTRLTLAKSLGVKVMERQTFEGAAEGAPYDITVDAEASAQSIGLAVRSTAHGGVIERVYGGLTETTEVPLAEMYGIGQTLHVERAHARHVIPSVLGHMKKCGHYHPEKVVTKTVDFADAAEAMLDPTIRVCFVRD